MLKNALGHFFALCISNDFILALLNLGLSRNLFPQ